MNFQRSEIRTPTFRCSRRATTGATWAWLGAWVMLSASLSLLGAATTNAVWTPDHVARLRAVTDAQVSPDGRYVAYAVAVPRRPGIDDDGDPWTELWMLNTGTGETRPFVTGKSTVDKPAWTPNGKGIAFLAKRGDDKFKSLYVLPVDGGEARRAVGLKSDIADFSLAPDGKRVALLATSPEDEARKKLKDKGFKQEIFEEEARVTRVSIAALFDREGSAPRVLDVPGSVRQALWSPVGGLLAMAVTPTPSVDDGMMRQTVIVVDVEKGSTVSKVDHAAKLGGLAWSPDGTRLAFVAGEDLHDPSAGRVFVVSARGGGNPRHVSKGLSDAAVLQATWTGNDRLVVAVARGVVSGLWEIRVDGDEALTKALLGPGQPVVTGLSASSTGGLIAMVGNTARHPGEVFTWEPGGAAKRRTDSNPDLAGLRWAKQEVIRHKARDGLELEGILIHPLDTPAGGKAPLLLTVHGGPEAHVSDGWLTSYSNPGQVAAARGFAVFYPNYRGSTGRGVAFSKLGQGDAAGKEFDDLIDAVDHLVAAGIVDAGRVGVTGGSYGGYATAWCSTRYSDRFAAGVMFVGISDKLSKVGTTDIPDEEYLVHARKRPWEDWQFLLERSPIYHAGRSRTPLLILHGADDPRVHPGQSKEMYRHLKLRGSAPVRLVLYPGEGHGNRKAAARYDYQLRMLQWFAHYLQGQGGAMPGPDVDYALPAASAN